MTYYFAYGSNLHRAQMAKRCPAAVPLGRLKLPDWRLVFRGVADCIPEPGAAVWGAVWQITADCERALDNYEGVSRGLYRKEYIPIEFKNGPTDDMLIYTMNSTGIFPPSSGYLGVIEQGYRDFRMPKMAGRLLAHAVVRAWDDKAPSHLERQRYRRTGRPKLVARASEPAPRESASGA